MQQRENLSGSAPQIVPAAPLRVAQVLNRFDSGGIEAVVTNYYHHMDKTRVQFDFFCAVDSKLPQRAALEAQGAGLYPIPPYSHPLAYHRALTAAFRKGGYAIVHAQLSTMSVFPLFAAWRAGVPVRICHNHSTAHKGEGKKALLKLLLRPFNKLTATHWFACSEAAGRWMFGDAAFDSGKVTVVPNAIETEKFAFDLAARAALRTEWGLPETAFVLGHVGRFTYAKNHLFLLQTFAALHAAHPEARLVLVGEGELEAEVRAQADALHLTDAVVFAGVRQDVWRVYSAFDAFALPSHFEGLGMVAWEAQANGLPCLLSEQVPAEAVLSPALAQRLPAHTETDAARWAELLPALRRGEAAAAKDLPTEAAKLQAFYERCGEEHA